MPNPIFEVCVDSVDSAVAAEQGGATRVELCAALLEGGLTPSAGTIAITRAQVSIGLQVMIRPRGGDFLYSDTEFASMKHDIELAKQLGSNGVVFGLLTAAGDIDSDRTRVLLDLAKPMNVTFHRAFDMTRDPIAALETLIELGINRVLTSGQEVSALEGAELVHGLLVHADDKIIVMPGGGITEQNIKKVLDTTGAKEIHVTGTRTKNSAMTFRNDRCFMGGVIRPPEYSMTITDADRIRALVRQAK
jgi:copper homeostasis protein